MASSTEIAHDFPPFIRVYTDGRVERFIAIPHLPPSPDPLTGIQSKDIIISPHLQIKSRIFLPKLNPPHKLPLIIYVHGGAFCTASPLNIATQRFLTPLVSQTPAVTVAIGYRLAPEHPLPTAYHDCWEAFQWIASHASGRSGEGTDPWINDYVDTGREVPDELTRYLYPGSSGSDNDPKLNPGADPHLEKLSISRVLVVVAGKDYLKPRGVAYYETLRESKWDGSIELVENEDEDHVFYLLNPSRETAKALFQLLISFRNQI
ncbi:hypothetical protein L1987_65309 [Smallanthus sonchifolius]|uniref:Uncharacterized protein n=1 Tax=Smallanthus sonchifolius TaxID=185202 RepID=A0ACB9BU44_9ASTR|nr:hypothetical protein L1987_65309 [Smallanthus sonchifolius]